MILKKLKELARKLLNLYQFFHENHKSFWVFLRQQFFDSDFFSNKGSELRNSLILKHFKENPQFFENSNNHTTLIFKLS